MVKTAVTYWFQSKNSQHARKGISSFNYFQPTIAYLLQFYDFIVTFDNVVSLDSRNIGNKDGMSIRNIYHLTQHPSVFFSYGYWHSLANISKAAVASHWVFVNILVVVFWIFRKMLIFQFTLGTPCGANRETGGAQPSLSLFAHQVEDTSWNTETTCTPYSFHLMLGYRPQFSMKINLMIRYWIISYQIGLPFTGDSLEQVFTIPYSRTDTFICSFVPAETKIWNCLTPDVRSLGSVDALKVQLEKTIVAN